MKRAKPPLPACGEGIKGWGAGVSHSIENCYISGRVRVLIENGARSQYSHFQQSLENIYDSAAFVNKHLYFIMLNIFPKIPVPKIKLSRWEPDLEALKWVSTQPITKITEAVIQILASVPRMTHCRSSLIQHSLPTFTLIDGTVVRTWTNPIFGDDHVFLADPDGKTIFGGFVWLHRDELKNAIELIRKRFT